MGGYRRALGALALCGAAGALAIAAPGDADAGTDAREQARVELGRRLFFDPTVSREGTIACAGCHDPEQGFSDPRQVSVDEAGPLKRHSQPLLDLHGDGFHWDGEFRTVRELIDARLASPDAVAALTLERAADRVEAAAERGTMDEDVARRRVPQTLASPGPYGGASTPRTRQRTGAVTASLTTRLSDDDRYDAGFRLAFGSPGITHDRVAEALEAYLGSLRSTESPFDRFLAGDPDAMSDSAERGFELFAGKAGCATCHTVGGSGAGRALSDGRYHNTGVALRGRTREGELDAGRTEATLDSGDHGRFKTPNLRDVARRSRFMHDGTFTSLEEVVRYYDRGGTPNAHLDPAIRPLRLKDGDVRDLVAFLEALTGDERPGLGDLADHRPGRVRVRLVDLRGRALRKTELRVVPFGDRLRGADELGRAFTVTTDRGGYASFPFPASTHVMLEVDGHTVGQGRPLPDFATGGTFYVTPSDQIAVHIRSRRDVKLPSELRTLPTKRMGFGRPVTGATTVLRRLRTLGPDSAIYVAPAPTTGQRPFHALHSAQSPGVLGTFRIDMAGGSLTRIDLRDGFADEQFVDRARKATARLLSVLPGAAVDAAVRSRQAPPSRR